MAEKSIVQEHRCTSCGEQLQFDPQLQTLVCRGCKTEAAPGQSGGAEAAVQTAGLTCPNCGAELPSSDGVARQAICGFCDSTFSVLQDGEDCPLLGEVPENHRYIIPFSENREAYQRGMISWLAGEKGTPVDAFDEIGMIRGGEGYYIPHYICVASYQVQWTASIGYDRVETYVVHVTRTVNGRTETIPETRTRIVTDWHPGSGTAAGRVTNECPATNFLEEMYNKVEAANTKESLKGIKDSSNGRFSRTTVTVSPTSARPHAGVPFDSKYTAGFQVLPCEIPATQSYDKNFVHQEIARAIEASAPGDRIRGLQFQGSILPSYALAYVPIWASIYSYRNKLCASHADGTRVETHFGTRPIDKDQKKRARMAFLPFLISIGLVAIFVILAEFGLDWAAWDMYETVRTIGGGLMFGTLIAGFVIRARIFRKSKQSLAGQVGAYLENPSRLFGRKSSKDDPIRELTK